MYKIALAIVTSLCMAACSERPAETTSVQDTSEPESTLVEEVTVDVTDPGRGEYV